MEAFFGDVGEQRKNARSALLPRVVRELLMALFVGLERALDGRAPECQR
jgi:hypothetical protein